MHGQCTSDPPGAGACCGWWHASGGSGIAPERADLTGVRAYEYTCTRVSTHVPAHACIHVCARARDIASDVVARGCLCRCVCACASVRVYVRVRACVQVRVGAVVYSSCSALSNVSSLAAAGLRGRAHPGSRVPRVQIGH